ncbi:MAG: acetylxylan esterase [Vicinamibacteraceae bacterium]
MRSPLLVAAAVVSFAAGTRAIQPPGPRPPAASLSRPDSPAKAPDAAGFIRRWLVLEPIAVPPQLGEAAVQKLVKDARFADQLNTNPTAGERVAVGDQQLVWHALDTRGYNLNLFHFAYALGKPTSNVLFWVTTTVDAPRDLPGVRLAIGSNAASVWWLNGQEVIGLYNDRQAVIDDGVSKRVTLKKGANVIRVAIVNGGGATDFCARFIDEGGRPVTGFTARVTGEGTGR